MEFKIPPVMETSALNYWLRTLFGPLGQEKNIVCFLSRSKRKGRLVGRKILGGGGGGKNVCFMHVLR